MVIRLSSEFEVWGGTVPVIKTLRVYRRSSFEIFPAFWYREWIVFMRAMALMVRSSLGEWATNLSPVRKNHLKFWGVIVLTLR